MARFFQFFKSNRARFYLSLVTSFNEVGFCYNNVKFYSKVHDLFQVSDGTKDVAVGQLIALIVNEGEDWKDVAMPVASVSPAPTTTASSAAPATKAAPASQQPQ